VDSTQVPPYDEGLFVSSATFRLHLAEIEKVFRIVPLKNILDGGDNTKPLCAITLDDGWHDNFVIAYPILKQLRSPATVFLPAAKIGTSDGFWFQRLWDLARAIKDSRKETVFVRYFQEKAPHWSIPSLSQAGLTNLTKSLKNMPANKLDGIVEGAFDCLSLRSPARRTTINWDEARIMGQNGISFGSHGLRHYILPTLDQDAKRKEIFGSLELLEQKEIPVAKYFSYPNGDWDVESLRFIREAGYKGALALDGCYNNRQTNPFLLSRLSVHEDIGNHRNLLWFRILQAIIAGPATPSTETI